MRRLFVLTFLGFTLLWGLSLYAGGGKTQIEIEQIDQRILELQDAKRGYEGRALRHEDLADRLQFDDRTYLEARRHYQLADENRAKAAAVQEEIDRLQAEKAKLSKIG